MSFAPADYGPVFEPLLAIDRRRPLDEGRPSTEGAAALTGLTVEQAFDGDLSDVDMACCCLAGVWLLYDHLDRSHTISQSISTREGSFWHGVMHRREGDFSNAKYWFRNVGHHPVHDTLSARFGAWDPYDFVDRCQAAVRSGQEVDACLDAQQAEWEALFDHCWRGAVGR